MWLGRGVVKEARGVARRGVVKVVRGVVEMGRG